MTVYEYMNWPRIEAIIYGEEASARDVMGPRIQKDGVLIQGYFPEAEQAVIKCEGKEIEMEKQDETGYFAVLLPIHKIPSYTCHVRFKDRWEHFADAYAFPGQISEEEERSFLAGVWYEAYRKLGAHPMTVNGVKGVYFAVWAPNALRVSLVGDFNRWDGRRLPMHRMPASGIFELFVPGIGVGEIYKYEMLKKGGGIQLKADPYANAAEAPQEIVFGNVLASPQGTASMIYDVSGFTWHDEDWFHKRSLYAGKERKQLPLSIYETSLTEWSGKEELADFLTSAGYTHVEFHPVMEYLDENSAGYSTSSYFAPTSRYGTPGHFQELVDHLHQAGIGVILDWTPAQFPRHEAGLSMFDGTPLYEVQDPAFAVHPMWDTMLYNYGSPMVVDFLLSNACFWADIYHADGLRLDDVDAMLYLDYGRGNGPSRTNLYGGNENLEAVEFLKHLNSIIHKRCPGFLTIAQEDGLWPSLTGSVEDDTLGFDFKWSGGWTTDFLQYLAVDPVYRREYHDQLTLSMIYSYSEHYILPLGSRDVGTLAAFRDRIFGTPGQKQAQIREAYAYQAVHPGAKMSAPDKHMPEELKNMFHDLNSLLKNNPALYEMDDVFDGFEWIQLMKYDENVLSFLRKTEKPGETLLVLCNFSAVSYENYVTGVPFYGKYKEIFNSDSISYGGSGYINPRAKTSLKKEADERACSIKINLAPLSVCIFSCTPAEEPAEAVKKAGSAADSEEKKPAKTGAPGKKAKAPGKAKATGKSIKPVEKAKTAVKSAKAAVKEAREVIEEAAKDGSTKVAGKLKAALNPKEN